MEEEVKEIQAKLEIKEECILPLVDIENNLRTVKHENKDSIEILNPEVFEGFESKTEETIVTQIGNEKQELKLEREKEIIEKTELENYKDELSSYVAEISSKADSEEIIEDIFPDNCAPDEMEDNISSEIDSSLQQSNPVRQNKKYVKERKFTCSYCDKRFTRRYILRIHTRIHTGMKPYECSYCCKRYISMSLLKRHTLNHTGKRFVCSYCGKLFSQLQHLNQHILIHEGKKPFKCALCPKFFRQRSCIIKHTRSMHKVTEENQGILSHISNLECEVNDMKTSTKGKITMVLGLECNDCGECLACKGLLEHTKSVHYPTSFTCDECGKCFSSRDNIVSHIKQKHTQKNPDETFICSECGKDFNSKDAVASHIRYMHIPEYNIGYYCRICGFRSTSKKNLKLHGQVHQNVYPFKCEYCNMSFKRKLSLKNHYITHGSEKIHKCTDCNSSFKQKSNLKAHIEVRHNNGQEKFACQICNMEFKRKSYLKRHIETHTDADKKYVCNECGLRCRSKTDIAKHVLTHFGAVERPHECEVCGAGFSKRSHLVRHKRVHSDERPFLCQLCDKSYKDTGSLKIHHETVHCGAFFSCDGCGFQSNNRQSFTRHLRQCQE